MAPREVFEEVSRQSYCTKSLAQICHLPQQTADLSGSPPDSHHPKSNDRAALHLERITLSRCRIDFPGEPERQGVPTGYTEATKEPRRSKLINERRQKPGSTATGTAAFQEDGSPRTNHSTYWRRRVLVAHLVPFQRNDRRRQVSVFGLSKSNLCRYDRPMGVERGCAEFTKLDDAVSTYHATPRRAVSSEREHGRGERYWPLEVTRPLPPPPEVASRASKRAKGSSKEWG